MTQTTPQTRKYIAPQGAEELCLTQFSHVSNVTDPVFFLPTTSPFEWQSFLPRQPLSAPSDHNPAWLETMAWDYDQSRLSERLQSHVSMSNATSLPTCFRSVRRMGLSNWRTLRLRNQTDRQVCRATTSLMNLLLTNWYRPSNRNLGSVFLRLSRLT